MAQLSSNAHLCRPPSMFARIGGGVFGSALPSFGEELEFIRTQGITTIISLEPMPARARSQAGWRNLKVLDYPLPDGQVPTPALVDNFLALIETELKAGAKVLIHCLAGQERTGLMAAFYLIRFEGKQPHEALEEAKKKFKGKNPQFEAFLLSYGASVIPSASCSRSEKHSEGTL